MMKIKTSDPIVAELRRTRNHHAAQFGYDIKTIFRHIQKQQQASGRKYVRYPARPVKQMTTLNCSH